MIKTALTNLKFMIRNKTNLPDKQYRILMKSVNNNGKSIISRPFVTEIERNTSQNTSISDGTAQALDS